MRKIYFSRENHFDIQNNPDIKNYDKFYDE